MEKLTNAYKLELLNALSDLEINSEDFDHQLEDSNTTTANCSKQFETENLNVGIVLKETVEWEAYDYYETKEVEIEDIEVICLNGYIEIGLHMKTQLENTLNY